MKYIVSWMDRVEVEIDAKSEEEAIALASEYNGIDLEDEKRDVKVQKVE